MQIIDSAAVPTSSYLRLGLAGGGATRAMLDSLEVVKGAKAGMKLKQGNQPSNMVDSYLDSNAVDIL